MGQPQLSEQDTSPTTSANQAEATTVGESAVATVDGALPMQESESTSSTRRGDQMSAVQRDLAAGITEHPGLLGQVVAALRDVYDPEIPVNIYDLGLVYEVQLDETGRTTVVMTLTSPMCPVAESLPVEVKRRVQQVAGVSAVSVELTWDPQWGMDKMSEEARLQLNFFY